jgi:hypothetical protein
MDVVRGQKPYNALRFRDTCTDRKLVTKHKPQVKKKNLWSWFFSFWVEETKATLLHLPLFEHEQNMKQKINSGHGQFFMIGDAFLLHKHHHVVLYDPFFNYRRHFDIQWFGRLTSLPGTYYIFNILYTNLCLHMQMEQKTDPFRWVVQKHNFKDFSLKIDDKGVLHVSVKSPILSIQRSYHTKDAQFLCFPVLVTLPNGIGHTTSLVYNMRNQTWEHFEPNGYIRFFVEHVDDFLEQVLPTFIRQGDGFLPMTRLMRVKEITPEPCFQQHDKKGFKPSIDQSQYCATWTFWFLHTRFLHRDKDPGYIVQEIIRTIENVEKRDTYIVYIRSFALLMSRILQEFQQVFSGYAVKSWFTKRHIYQERIRDIFDFYIETYF